MDKSNTQILNLGIGATDNSISYIVPTGKLFVVRSLKAGIPSMNDGYSANVILRWGTEIIDFIVECGSSRQVEVNKEFLGDGSTAINILVQNTSTVAKTIAVKYDAYERDE